MKNLKEAWSAATELQLLHHSSSSARLSSLTMKSPRRRSAAPGSLRFKGPEMRRELTNDEKEPANAGYWHLAFDRLATQLHAIFDANIPSKSEGLSSAEAAARLIRERPNCLTPSKKKPACRNVVYRLCLIAFYSTWYLAVHSTRRSVPCEFWQACFHLLGLSPFASMNRSHPNFWHRPQLQSHQGIRTR